MENFYHGVFNKFFYPFIMSESNKPGFVSKNMIVVINLENLLPNFSSDYRNFVEIQNMFLLFGLALGGVYLAIFISKNGALTTPFHPCQNGGIFSVALSLGLPPLELSSTLFL